MASVHYAATPMILHPNLERVNSINLERVNSHVEKAQQGRVTGRQLPGVEHFFLKF
jgi:hypothetical protein